MRTPPLQMDPFDNIKKDIKALECQLHDLATLKDSMSSVTPDIFDKEDIYIVSETHKQVLQKCTEKVASFQYKKRLYDGQIKSIQIQVDKRIQLLKDPKYEKTFKQFPELLSFYVQKQASMNQSLDNVIQSIKDE